MDNVLEGTFEKGCHVPRMSTGPDLHHIVLGSEGTMGVVTEVILRLRPVPPVRKYGNNYVIWIVEWEWLCSTSHLYLKQ